MSILTDTVWTLPARMRGVTDSKFTPISTALDNPSPWTGERPKSDPFLQMWTAELTFPAAPEKATPTFASWRERAGWVTRVRGTSGLMRVADTFRLYPAYDLTHDPALANWSDGSTFSDGSQWVSGPLPPFVTVDEAARAGADSVVVRGLPVDTEDALNPNDLMEGRPDGQQTPYGNLYEVIHCARSNSDGKTRVYFQPGLREGFAPGDPFFLREATCVFRFPDKNQGIVTRSMDWTGRHGMSLIEHLIDV